MVRMNGNPVHQLVDKVPLLGFGGRLPQMLDIEVLEKAPSDIGCLPGLSGGSTALLLNGIDLQCESSLLFLKRCRAMRRRPTD